MNKIIRSLAFIAAVCSLMLLCSCGDVGYTDEEIISTARTLVEASYEINELYFGEGLPTTGETSVSSTFYSPVTEESPYHSVSEIKAATEKVYTADYCEILFKIGFEGSSLESDDEKVTYARFIDDFNGELTARKDLKETSLLAGRTYDFSTATVEKAEKNSARIKIVSLVNGVEDVSVTLTLKLENGSWRLDTPTY